MSDGSPSASPSRGAHFAQRRVAVAAATLLMATAVACSPLGQSAGVDSASVRVGAVGAPGVIKSVCSYSHTAADDPIVKPGQPGASHSHDFYGNPTVDAFSTLETLKTGGTTCNFAEDHSGYWIPTLYRNGATVRSSEIAAYYTLKGADAASVQPYPEGLRLVAGDSMATSPQSLGVTSWACVDANKQPKSEPAASVPSCQTGDSLQLSVHFPQCWDGTNLDSGNHKTHLAYLANPEASCPPDHPVLVPSLTLFALYPIAGGSGVTLASGGQYSAHGDFFNAWEPSRLADLVSACLVSNMSCGPGSITVDEAFSDEAHAMVFNVRLTAPSPSPVEVDYATEDVTALMTSDYTAVSGHLTFPTGSVVQTVKVPLVDDKLSENTEALLLRLSNPVNAGLGMETRVGSILDNDPLPTLSIADSSVTEPSTGTRSLRFTVTLAGAVGRPVTFSWATANGTAAAPGDYTSASGSMTFPVGVTSKTISVTVKADAVSERAETVKVNLSAVVAAAAGDFTAVGTINPA